MTAFTVPLDDNYTSRSRRTITALPPNGVACVAADTFSNPVSLYCGTGGTVVATPAGGGADITTTVASGGYFPCEIVAVKAGTTATGMVAVY